VGVDLDKFHRENFNHYAMHPVHPMGILLLFRDGILHI